MADQTNSNQQPELDPRDANLFQLSLSDAIRCGALLDMGEVLQQFRVHAHGYLSTNAWEELTDGDRFHPDDGRLIPVALAYALAIAGQTPRIADKEGFLYFWVPCPSGAGESVLLRAALARSPSPAVLITSARFKPVE